MLTFIAGLIVGGISALTILCVFAVPIDDEEENYYD